MRSKFCFDQCISIGVPDVLSRQQIFRPSHWSLKKNFAPICREIEFCDFRSVNLLSVRTVLFSICIMLVWYWQIHFLMKIPKLAIFPLSDIFHTNVSQPKSSNSVHKNKAIHSNYVFYYKAPSSDNIWQKLLDLWKCQPAILHNTTQFFHYLTFFMQMSANLNHQTVYRKMEHL